MLLALAPAVCSLKSAAEREAALSALGSDRPELSIADDLQVPPDLGKMGIKRGADVFVTFATGSLQAFALNWVHYIRQSNLSPYMIGALDQAMFDLCVERGIPAYLVNGSDILTKRDVTYFKPGSPVFKKMGTVKTKFILEMLRMGLNPILSDADVMWLRDPREHFRRGTYGSADILISTDCIDLPADHRDDGGCAHVNFNTGILHFKATDGSRRFVRKWHETIVSHLDQHWMRDQPAFNLLIRDGTDIGKNWKAAPMPPPGERRVFEVAGGLVKLGPLPSWLFVGGHVFFIQELTKHWDEGPSGLHFDEKPYALHMTYQYGDSGEYPWGKRQRLRSLGMWHHDPLSYYENGNFLTLAPEASQLHVPPVDVERGADSRKAVKLHLEEDKYRRPAIRAAFAAAQALNRTLILPRMYCYADNIWNNLINGRAPGGEAQALPFECPTDHIFKLDMWFKGGFKEKFREAVFLDNPAVPEVVRRDVARVQVLPKAQGDGAAPAPAEGYDLALREGLTDGQLREALQGLAHHRVLELSAVKDLLCGFENAEEAKAFDNTMGRMLEYRMYFCPTEPWRAAGSPRVTPWEPDIVKRHCGSSEAALLHSGRVHLGEFQDDPTCFCEFGFKTPPALGQCRRA